MGTAWAVIVGNGLAGLWALAAHRRPALRHPALWWFTALAQASAFVQAGLGAALVAGEGRPVDEFHMLYGFSALVAVGILYSYRQTSPWVAAHLHLVYGLGGLFLMGLGIRALFLG